MSRLFYEKAKEKLETFKASVRNLDIKANDCYEKGDFDGYFLFDSQSLEYKSRIKSLEYVIKRAEKRGFVRQ